MGRAIATRIAAILPILFGVSVFIFLLMHLAPGDVTSTMLGPMASDEAKAQLRVALGLDHSMPFQYFKWLGNVLQGDLGKSLTTTRPVTDMVLPRFGNTVILTVASMILAMAIGFGVGMYAAARSFSVFDRVSMSATLVVGSTPPFWLGLILVLLLALDVRLFPATGMTSITGDGGVWDVLRHLVLSALAIAAASAAIITWMIRFSMLEVLN